MSHILPNIFPCISLKPQLLISAGRRQILQYASCMTLKFIVVDKMEFSDVHLRNTFCTLTLPSIWHICYEYMSFSLTFLSKDCFFVSPYRQIICVYFSQE
jgi:hypothetical protein